MKEVWRHQNLNELIIELPTSQSQAQANRLLDHFSGNNLMHDFMAHSLKKEKEQVKVRLKFPFPGGRLGYNNDEQYIFMSKEEARQMAQWILNTL